MKFQSIQEIENHLKEQPNQEAVLYYVYFPENTHPSVYINKHLYQYRYTHPTDFPCECKFNHETGTFEPMPPKVVTVNKRKAFISDMKPSDHLFSSLDEAVEFMKNNAI